MNESIDFLRPNENAFYFSDKIESFFYIFSFWVIRFAGWDITHFYFFVRKKQKNN